MNSDWVKIERTIRKRYCEICSQKIPARTEVFKIYHKSFHLRCLFKALAVTAGKERYDKLLNEFIADQV